MHEKIILKVHLQVGEHIPSGFSMSTVLSFKNIKNKYDGYKVKDCMKKFCEYLRQRAIDLINFKKKKNEVINKQTVEIISKCKTLLHL